MLASDKTNRPGHFTSDPKLRVASGRRRTELRSWGNGTLMGYLAGARDYIGATLWDTRLLPQAKASHARSMRLACTHILANCSAAHLQGLWSSVFFTRFVYAACGACSRLFSSTSAALHVYTTARCSSICLRSRQLSRLTFECFPLPECVLEFPASCLIR